MNRRTIVPILLVCTFALLAPPPALADFTDLEVVDRTDLTICQDPSEPDIPFKLDVCEIHAVFDDPADRLISVAFSNVSTTDTNGFYQHSLNTTNSAPSCSFVTQFPTLVCDSFISVGVDCFDLIDNTTIDPDFDFTKFNSTGEVSGGWFNSAPSNGQGDPDANGRVLMGRFSYKQNKNTSGDVCVFTQLAGSNDIIEFLLLPFDCANPGLQGVGGGGAGAGGGECAPGTTVCYVDDPGFGLRDCSTWGNACGELQVALDKAANGICDEIWVAQGTYLPDYNVATETHTGIREMSFELQSCVGLYGGYPNGGGTRDPENLITILSGDLDGDDISEEFPNGPSFDDNSYHVVVAGSDTTSVDGTAILDGFTVTRGNANIGEMGAPNGTDKGSAVSIWINSTPALENCTFLENYAEDHGAVNDHGGATLLNCEFRDNVAKSHGAGLYVHVDIGTTVTDCAFYDNVALGIPAMGPTPAIPGKGAGAYVKENLNPPGAEPTFTDCIFSGNEADEGGAFYSGAGRSPRITSGISDNCTFSANIGTSLIGKGAAIYTDVGSLTVSDCTFSGNSVADTAGKGGAIYVNGASGSDPLIERCTFTSNLGGGCGGAIYMGPDSTPKIRDCQFIDNSGVTPGSIYGGAIYGEGAKSEVVNCVFQDNTGRAGGAIYQLDVPVDPEDVLYMDVRNCTFINNLVTDLGTAGPAGGGAISSKRGPLLLTNCLFVGNRATSGITVARGGAVKVHAGTELIASNCTFVGNSAKTVGGGIFIASTAATTNALDNCVFWDNEDNGGANDESAQVHFATTTAPAVTYSDLMNLVEEGDFDSPLNIGNIGGDPKFVAFLTGTWTDDGVYCDQACMDVDCSDCDGLVVGQSKFTSGASYMVDEHVGKLLNVNSTQTRVALIAANTVTTITIWGDLTTVGGDTNPYQIDDYRLQSGSLPEDPPSPCIDAGDNTATGACGLDLDGNERFVDDPAVEPDTGQESPEHPEDIVDMGAYEFDGLLLTDCNANAIDDDCEVSEGTTPDCNANGIPDECDIADGTSLDCNANGVPDSCCTADRNGDEVVDAFDLASLLGSWGDCPAPCPSDCSCLADFNNDCEVEAFDLADLLGQWGPCP